MSGGHTTDDIRLDGSPLASRDPTPLDHPSWAVDLRSPTRPVDPAPGLSANGYASFGDADTPAEVDAVFRLQRRVAIAHFLTFIFVTLGVSVTTVTLDWAATSRVFGGFSPGFALAAIGLYLFFVIVAVAAATLANSIEDRMMGATSLPSEPPPQ